MATGTHKRRATTVTGKVIGLFATVWVSLALQPCAVAAAAEHDCPHCPTEIEAMGETAHRHHGSGEGASTAAGDCASMQADCCDLGERIVSVRLADSDLDDPPAVLPPTVPGSDGDVTPRRDGSKATGPPRPSWGRVPLHVLNCVYLK